MIECESIMADIGLIYMVKSIGPRSCVFWVIKCMFPVRYLAPKILMAINNYERQLARRLWFAAHPYYKKGGVTLHPGARKYSLQYDVRPDWRFGMWIEMWNLGSLIRKGGSLRTTQKEDD